ncbi:hypothetical protein PR048_003675 [Dryococelus australis]|uniref:HAT C-terminal dimerisation domain-containing protein n=1 Tax=Dryococelus australis TaxID=614101 RepID=A0ABQ9IQ12_9NEOP|nr:hypothetical protein PR048_003675 [Dryococelus australis]
MSDAKKRRHLMLTNYFPNVEPLLHIICRRHEARVCPQIRLPCWNLENSVHTRGRLLNVQQNRDLPQLKLIQDVETRWSTEYAMLDRLVSSREAVAAELSSSDVDSFSPSEWKLEVMKPFPYATKECCGNNYPTASMVIPTIHCLEVATTNHIRKNEFGTGVQFACNLLKALRSRFPMYKMDDMCSVPGLIQDTMFDYERQHAVNILKKDIKVNSTEVAKTPTKHNTSLNLGSLWDVIYNIPLQLPEAQQRFPLVSQVAVCYLSLPATQVASKRGSSTAGNIITNLVELSCHIMLNS